MKRLLTALLISFLVFGCRGNDADRIYRFSVAPKSITFEDKTPSTDVFGEDTVTIYFNGNVDTISISPSPSPIPDTTKPIKKKIKMQPRWEGPNRIMYGDEILDSLRHAWLDASKATRGETFTITGFPNQDTSKVIMLVSDTSSINGFRSSRCWWMEGYRLEKEMYLINGENIYLDVSKIPLKKNIIVWLSKEIK